MSSQLTITERVLARLTTIADPARLAEPGEPLPWSVLHDLAELVPCDDLVWLSFDPHRHQTLATQGIGAQANSEEDPELHHAGQRTEIDATFWANFWRWGNSRPERTGNLAAFRPADTPLERDPARAFAHYFSLIGPRHQITVPLAVRAGVTRELVFIRYDGRNFSDREVSLLTLIRPHLSELNAAALRRQATPGRLTPRQQQLLQHVAAGLTNGQIGRRMGISEGTVRKHLENIFAALGVTNRTSAAEYSSTPASTVANSIRPGRA
jgi:DNA-binding CsgD family transcriptional regulator